MFPSPATTDPADDAARSITAPAQTLTAGAGQPSGVSRAVRGGRCLRLSRARLAWAIVAASLCTLVVPPSAAQQPADGERTAFDLDPQLDAYLERHGLTTLTIAHLQRRFSSTTNDEERLLIAERLAELYVHQIENAGTDAEREKWGAEVASLLRRMPAGATEKLRLNLNIASYLEAERVAERWRLRAADMEEVSRARQTLRAVSSEFTELIGTLDRRVRRVEQRTVDPLNSRDQQERSAQLAELDSMLSRARYYGAWAMYYKGWLPPDVPDDAQDARDALTLFARILQADGDEPKLEELPLTLLEFEHVARAALGAALCYALLDRPNTALDWLEAINTDGTHLGVKSQLPAYRIAIAFDRANRTGSSWNVIEDQIATLEREGTLTPTVLRLVAVLSLERSQVSADPGVRRIAAIAIERLAALDRLGEVLEIARQFDLQTLDATAFTVQYVLALEAHQIARDLHEGEEPTRDLGEKALYEEAERQLQALLDRDDAPQYPEACAHAQFLIAWSRYFRAAYAPAAEAFATASRDLEPERAEQSAWMRIVSLDRQLRDTPGDSQSASDLQTAMDEYLRRFPGSTRAGRIQYRLAVMTGDKPTIEQVDQLLSVPPGSDAYVTSRNEAERRLYRLFLDARAMERVDLARRHLDIALPLLAADRQAVRGDAADVEAGSRYIQRARRVLDVMLARGVARIQDARSILDGLEATAAAGLVSVADLETELGYRRFQIDLRSGRSSEAAEWADAAWAVDPESPFASAATLEMYRYAFENWKGTPAGPAVPQMLDWTVRYGRRLIERAGDDPVLDDPALLRLALDVAEASLERHRLTNDEADQTFARTWFARLLEVQPNHPPIMRANAEFAERDGRTEAAIELWRAMLGRFSDTSEAWFEAKYHVARLLALTDRERALEILKQHVLLHPGYGPPPWGARMADLATSLESGAVPPPTDESNTSPDDETESAPPTETTPPPPGGGSG